MNSREQRLFIFSMIGIIAMMTVSFLVIKDEIPEQNSTRKTELDQANDDSLFYLWVESDNGEKIDLRTGTIILGVILFVSVFASIILGEKVRKKYD